ILSPSTVKHQTPTTHSIKKIPAEAGIYKAFRFTRKFFSSRNGRLCLFTGLEKLFTEWITCLSQDGVFFQVRIMRFSTDIDHELNDQLQYKNNFTQPPRQFT